MKAEKVKKRGLPKARVLSVYEFMRWIPDEETAIRYLKRILWQGTPTCPFCRSERHHVLNNGVYFCDRCRKTYTIRTNTIFHRSHIPLHKWLFAMYLVVTARKGISSLQLSKELGITQKSAWFMLQRIRTACGNRSKWLLEGIVEVDEVYIGGKEKNKHSKKRLYPGGGSGGKIPVVGMRSRQYGRVVAQVVDRPDKETLTKAIRDNISVKHSRTGEATVICTDDSRLYNDVAEHYEHKRVNHSAKQYVDGMASTNGIESVWALLKRGFYGTYHAFSRKHISRYIDEFVFRLNGGRCSSSTMDRLQWLSLGAAGTRLTYKMLTQGV